MIEAEWLDHDTTAEMADAVVGDVGLRHCSGLESRGEALVALPGGKSPSADPRKTGGRGDRLGRGDHHP